MTIHKGKDPSVELRCYTTDEEEQKKYSLSIMFTGDMERQKFVERLVEVNKGDKDDDDEINLQEEDKESNDSW